MKIALVEVIAAALSVIESEGDLICGEGFPIEDGRMTGESESLSSSERKEETDDDDKEEEDDDDESNNNRLSCQEAGRRTEADIM